MTRKKLYYVSIAIAMDYSSQWIIRPEGLFITMDNPSRGIIHHDGYTCIVKHEHTFSLRKYEVKRFVIMCTFENITYVWDRYIDKVNFRVPMRLKGPINHG